MFDWSLTTVQLKRQHSFEPPATSPSGAPATRGKSNSDDNTPTPTTASSPPTLLTSAIYDPTTSTPKDFTDPWSGTPKPIDAWSDVEKGIWGAGDRKIEDEALVGSPMKKQRASISGLDTEFRKGDVGRVLGPGGSSAGLGMGFAVFGAEGVKNDFGGELRRASLTTTGPTLRGPAEVHTQVDVGEPEHLGTQRNQSLEDDEEQL